MESNLKQYNSYLEKGRNFVSWQKYCEDINLEYERVEASTEESIINVEKTFGISLSDELRSIYKEGIKMGWHDILPLSEAKKPMNFFAPITS